MTRSRTMFSMPEQPAGGLAVRSARRQAGVTLRQFAADLGVSVGTMSAIENGNVGLTVDRLQKIARLLGMSAGELLELRTAPPRSAPLPEPRPSRSTGWREFEPLGLDPVMSSAVEVFNEAGYHGATMRVIATGAEISVAGMYHHYPSKQKLLVALVDLTLQDLEWRVAAASGEADTPVQEFTNIVEALTLFHAERQDMAYIVLNEMRSVEEPNRTRLASVQHRIQKSLDVAASRVADLDGFAQRDLPTTTRAIATMCLALPYRFPHGSPRSDDVPRLARKYSDLALNMMRSASAVP